MSVNLPVLSAQGIIVYGNYLLPLDEGELGWEWNKRFHFPPPLTPPAWGGEF